MLGSPYRFTVVQLSQSDGLERLSSEEGFCFFFFFFTDFNSGLLASFSLPIFFLLFFLFLVCSFISFTLPSPSILGFLALTSFPPSSFTFLLLLEAIISFFFTASCFSHFDSLPIPSRFGARALKSLFLSLLVFNPIIYSGTGQPELAITVAMERSRGRSASVKNVIALPLLPALPVLPILCM